MHPRSLLSAAVGVATFLTTLSQLLAGSVTLEWDANTEADLAGYRIYYGTSSRQYSAQIDVGLKTQFEVSGLDDGQKYYFAVTAYDQSGNESGYSDEVSTTIGDSKNPPDPTDPKPPTEPVTEQPPPIPVLYQNFPNPFAAAAVPSSGAQSVGLGGSSQTLIQFEVPEAGHATLKVFDALGREVMTLLDADVDAGLHSVYWDGRNSSGWMVPSGTYFYQLISGGMVQTKRMSFAR